MYGNGMSLHRESEMFNYWKRNGRENALRSIIQQSLGQAIVDHVDLLARNAFLKNPYAYFGSGSATGFNGITTSHRLSTDLVDAIQLGLKDRKLPYAAYPTNLDPGDVFCITSAGARYDLMREVNSSNLVDNKFVNIKMYADPSSIVNGEVGSYRGVRFIETPMSILWNAGAVTSQTTITAAVEPGDGAPDPETTAVDQVRYVGQPDATHSIAVTSSSGFLVGDKVTVHKLRRTSGEIAAGNYGVVDGLNWEDPMAQDMVIHSIPDGTHITFKEPYMMTDLSGNGLETNLGGGTYGYVTKATNIHTAIFFSGQYQNGIIAGVTQPPRIYTPPAVDDFESIYRITYDMWMKYQLWEPQVYEVAFIAGSNKDKGVVYSR